MRLVALLSLSLLLAVSCAAPWLAPHDPARQYRDLANAPPGGAFLLGTDEFGRDFYSRLLYSGRWSLLAGLLATALSLGFGTVLGLTAAGGPPTAESIILWLADLFMSLPWLYLLFAVRGLMPLSLPPETALLAVIALLGIAGWAMPARLIRAAAKGVLAMDYVRASRAFGASRFHVLARHVLPALGPVIAPQVFTLLPRYVLAESALSFLGLGLGEPTATWGSLLASARQSIATGGLHWWHLAPALPIAALTLASSICAGSGEARA